jgi:hypothetical protein
MDEINKPAPAATIADTLPELPRETQVMAAPPATGDAAATPPATGEPDAKGAAWDAALHESPPRRNRAGEWAKKRGNGARAAAGLPPTGRTYGRADLPAAPLSQSAPMVSHMGTTPPPAAAAPGQGQPQGAVDATAAPLLAESDYAGTAATVSRSFFVTMVMLFGAAWKPEPSESTALQSALQRVWAEHQLPRVGALWELAATVGGIFVKRRDDPETGKVVGGWFGRWRRVSPTAAPVQHEADAPQTPAEVQQVMPTAPAVVRKPFTGFAS